MTKWYEGPIDKSKEIPQLPAIWEKDKRYFTIPSTIRELIDALSVFSPEMEICSANHDPIIVFATIGGREGVIDWAELFMDDDYPSGIKEVWKSVAKHLERDLSTQTFGTGVWRDTKGKW